MTLPNVSKVWSASARISIALLIARTPAFILPLLTGKILGATIYTDAYFTTFAIVTLISNSFGAVLEQVSIPFLMEIKDIRHTFLSYVQRMTASLVLSSLFLVSLAAISLYFIPSPTHKFTPTRSLLISLLGFQVPYILLGVLSSSAVGVLLSKGRYLTAIFSHAIPNIIAITTLLALNSRLGIYSLILGYATGELVRSLILWPTAFRTFSADDQPIVRQPPSIKPLLKAGLSQMVASAIIATYPILDRMMILNYSTREGNISLLSYVERIWQGAIMFAISGFLTFSLREWSQAVYVDSRLDDVYKSVTRSARTAFLLSLPITIGMIALRDWAFQPIFSGMHLNAQMNRDLSLTLAVYMILLPPCLSALIFCRGLVLIKRSDLLLKISIVQVIIKTILNIILVPSHGIVGAAMSTAMMTLVGGVLQYVSFRGAVRTLLQLKPS